MRRRRDEQLYNAPDQEDELSLESILAEYGRGGRQPAPEQEPPQEPQPEPLPTPAPEPVPEPEPAPEPRLCPYCKSEIADDATRCPHCTSHLE